MLNINCDLGEGLNNENIIMPLIDSCNVACGGHAGDNGSMIECVEISIRNNVKIETHLIKNCDHHISIEASSIALNYILKKIK